MQTNPLPHAGTAASAICREIINPPALEQISAFLAPGARPSTLPCPRPARVGGRAQRPVGQGDRAFTAPPTLEQGGHRGRKCWLQNESFHLPCSLSPPRGVCGPPNPPPSRLPLERSRLRFLLGYPSVCLSSRVTPDFTQCKRQVGGASPPWFSAISCFSRLFSCHSVKWEAVRPTG